MEDNKEGSTKKIANNRFWTAIIIFAVLVIAALFLFKYNVDVPIDDSKDNNGVGGDGGETDYVALREECTSKGVTEIGCCVESLTIMEKMQYELTDGECDEGFSERTLSCSGSLSWCEPA